MELTGLKEGQYYKVSHKKAGTFIAQFVRLETGDDADPVLVTVRIPTWQGSGQEWYAQGLYIRDEKGRKVPPPFHDRRLRPQFIINMEKYNGRLASQKER